MRKEWILIAKDDYMDLNLKKNVKGQRERGSSKGTRPEKESSLQRRQF